MKALQHIIEAQTPQFLDSVLNCNDIATLNLLLAEEEDPERVAVIQARIQNLTHLVA